MGTKQNVKWTIPNWEIPKGEVHKLEIPWGANWKILNNAYLNQPKKKKTTQTTSFILSTNILIVHLIIY